MTTSAIKIDHAGLAAALRPKVEALEAARPGVRKRALLIVIGCLLAGIAMSAFYWSLGTAAVFFAAINGAAGGLIGLGLASRVVRRFKDEGAASLLPTVCDGIGGITFERAPADLPESEILFRWRILRSGNRVEFRNCLRGVYRNTDFMVSDAQVARRKSGKGKTGKTRGFKGLVAAISVPVPFGSTTIIGPDGGRFGNWLNDKLIKALSMPLERVAFPGGAFEDRYQVFGDNADDARRLVTKEFADTMLQFASAARGDRPRAGFVSGRFYLALPRRRPLIDPVTVFRPNRVSADWLEEIVRGVTTPHRLIDTLHGDAVRCL